MSGKLSDFLSNSGYFPPVSPEVGPESGHPSLVKDSAVTSLVAQRRFGQEEAQVSPQRLRFRKVVVDPASFNPVFAKKMLTEIHTQHARLLFKESLELRIHQKDKKEIESDINTIVEDWTTAVDRAASYSQEMKNKGNLELSLLADRISYELNALGEEIRRMQEVHVSVRRAAAIDILVRDISKLTLRTPEEIEILRIKLVELERLKSAETEPAAIERIEQEKDRIKSRLAAAMKQEPSAKPHTQGEESLLSAILGKDLFEMQKNGFPGLTSPEFWTPSNRTLLIDLLFLHAENQNRLNQNELSRVDLELNHRLTTMNRELMGNVESREDQRAINGFTNLLSAKIGSNNTQLVADTLDPQSDVSERMENVIADLPNRRALMRRQSVSLGIDSLNAEMRMEKGFTRNLQLPLLMIKSSWSEDNPEIFRMEFATIGENSRIFRFNNAIQVPTVLKELVVGRPEEVKQMQAEEVMAKSQKMMQILHRALHYYMDAPGTDEQKMAEAWALTERDFGELHLPPDALQEVGNTIKDFLFNLEVSLGRAVFALGRPESRMVVEETKELFNALGLDSTQFDVFSRSSPTFQQEIAKLRIGKSPLTAASIYDLIHLCEESPGDPEKIDRLEILKGVLDMKSQVSKDIALMVQNELEFAQYGGMELIHLGGLIPPAGVASIRAQDIESLNRAKPESFQAILDLMHAGIQAQEFIKSVAQDTKTKRADRIGIIEERRANHAHSIAEYKREFSGEVNSEMAKWFSLLTQQAEAINGFAKEHQSVLASQVLNESLSELRTLVTNPSQKDIEAKVFQLMIKLIQAGSDRRVLKTTLQLIESTLRGAEGDRFMKLLPDPDLALAISRLQNVVDGPHDANFEDYLLSAVHPLSMIAYSRPEPLLSMSVALLESLVKQAGYDELLQLRATYGPTGDDYSLFKKNRLLLNVFKNGYDASAPALNRKRANEIVSRLQKMDDSPIMGELKEFIAARPNDLLLQEMRTRLEIDPLREKAIVFIEQSTNAPFMAALDSFFQSAHQDENSFSRLAQGVLSALSKPPIAAERKAFQYILQQGPYPFSKKEEIVSRLHILGVETTIQEYFPGDSSLASIKEWLLQLPQIDLSNPQERDQFMVRGKAIAEKLNPKDNVVFLEWLANVLFKLNPASRQQHYQVFMIYWWLGLYKHQESHSMLRPFVEQAVKLMPPTQGNQRRLLSFIESLPEPIKTHSEPSDAQMYHFEETPPLTYQEQVQRYLRLKPVVDYLGPHTPFPITTVENLIVDENSQVDEVEILCKMCQEAAEIRDKNLQQEGRFMTEDGVSDFAFKYSQHPTMWLPTFQLGSIFPQMVSMGDQGLSESLFRGIDRSKAAYVQAWANRMRPIDRDLNKMLFLGTYLSALKESEGESWTVARSDNNRVPTLQRQQWVNLQRDERGRLVCADCEYAYRVPLQRTLAGTFRWSLQELYDLEPNLTEEQVLAIQDYLIQQMQKKETQIQENLDSIPILSRLSEGVQFKLFTLALELNRRMRALSTSILLRASYPGYDEVELPPNPEIFDSEQYKQFDPHSNF